jgi:FAD/FMN-containing dehydrogenase
VLLAELEGDDPAELAQRGEAARQALVALGAGVLEVVVASDPADVAALWAIRHGASSRLAALTDGRQSLQVIEDGCVPPARLGDYLDAVEQACAEAKVDVVMFGHAGDGHVHVNLLPNLRDPDWLPRVRGIFDAVNEALLRMGGTPAGEHGAGRLRAGLVERFLGPEATSAFRAVKAAFDPLGRFNPGVILAEHPDPFAHLKVGADATPLPEGIADALRRIEAEARWGESRWLEPRTANGERRTEDRNP